MSLINDALKRARHEALRQDSERGRTVYGAVPAHSRRTRRPWLLFLVGGAAAVAVAVTGWMVLGAARSPARTPQVETSREITEPPTELPVASSEGVAVAPKDPPVDPPTSGDGASRAVSEVAPTTADPPPIGRLAQEQAAPAVAASDPAEAEATPLSSTRQGVGERLQAGETYLRKAVASDGSDVRLGGIAYSDTHPIAVINGSVVSPGDMVAGFTVVAIEPERVELEADGVRIFLTLH